MSKSDEGMTLSYWEATGRLIKGRTGEKDAAGTLIGGGAVLREGLKKVAVYRDDEGKLHRRSAVCTHMGCVVRFNSLERTWDCPCHGSRFSALGDPINSPAITPLASLDDKE